MDKRVERFAVAVLKEFESAKLHIARTYQQVMNLQLLAEEEDGKIKLRFSDVLTDLVVEVPIPFQNENGVWLINDNETIRPVTSYFIKDDFREVGFLGMMLFLLTENLQKLKYDYPSKTPFLRRIMYGYAQDNPAWVVSNCQRMIDTFVHRLPLHETEMNSWAVNNRVEFLDPEFEAMRNPADKLEYQVKKNEDFFDLKGWTSIGLSESALSEKNYLLKFDLKRTIPFGLRHHHPKRNLYQTLGMKGDEQPSITTEDAEKLARMGIKRGGKMLLTAFVDIPFNFEDHIVAHSSLTKLMNFHVRKYQCFGELCVEVGQELKKGDRIAFNPDGEPVVFSVSCDKATVEAIIPRKVNVGGEEEEAFLVRVKVGRYLRDGTKFTNRHGNKGIASFKETGYAVDPRTGKKHVVDILVSSTSVKRRGNFGQILEAVATAIHGKDKKMVLPADHAVDIKKMENELVKAGLPKDGTWEVHTVWGKFRAVCGWVFWGVIKDPEDQLWEKKDTWVTDGRGRRRAGLKFSNIELRAIITQMGTRNPVVDEILSHMQGTEDLRQLIKVVESCRSSLPEDVPEIDALNIPPVDTNRSLLKEKYELVGTVGDEEFHPKGFVMALPANVFMLVPKNRLDGIRWCGSNMHEHMLIDDTPIAVDKLFVPYFNLRTSWRHNCGRYGLSMIGGLVNRVIRACHDLANEECSDAALARAVEIYINAVGRFLSTKRGEVAQFGMATRYPWSAKATATLGEILPENTVEIHRDMAKDLNVRAGDIVLAERFPCLGFMSVRPQKVKVTDDPACKYVIRVSGNSLVSQNLDFDGDVLYLASFHTPESKLALRKAFDSPHPTVERIIEEMNAKKEPKFESLTLQDYDIQTFDKLTSEKHALLVRRAVGVKSHTGPVIALAYNLMRIVESAVGYSNTEINAQVEKMLDQLGNTVFRQKHGITPLHDATIEAVCKADVESLVNAGFDRAPSKLICDIVRKRAEQIGIRDLEEHYREHKEEGRSSVINVIVRRLNKVYFASRASLEPLYILEHLDARPVDLPSHLFKRALMTKRDEIDVQIELMKAKLAEMRTQNVEAEDRIKKERFQKLWGLIRRETRGLSTSSGKEPDLNEFWPEVRVTEMEIPFVTVI